MRILSKFHDYYDTISSYGIDKTCIYKRITKNVKVASLKSVKFFTGVFEKAPFHRTICDSPHIELGMGVIGFCGRLYPTYIVGDLASRVVTSSLGQMYTAIVKYVAEDNKGGCKSKFNFMKFFNEFTKKKKGYRCHYSDSDKTSFDEFAKFVSGKRCDDIFFELQAPIFRCDGFRAQAWIKDTESEIIVNPRLQDIGFNSIHSHYWTFQEVYMYLSGVLGSTKEAPQITDDIVLRDSKGFDAMSFKTVSPGKKSHNKRRK